METKNNALSISVPCGWYSSTYRVVLEYQQVGTENSTGCFESLMLILSQYLLQ